MKKNVISLAVATSVAALGTAAVQADMYLNPEKTGQVLLFPFYDAENGNATNFHVVNTTDKAKAVKIRFREYKASREVLDFNLYLSAEDHFAFGVIMDPNGTGGAIITNDNSCTVPALGSPNNGFDGTTTENADGSITRIQPFVNFEFLKQVAGEDYVDSDVERTLRGHVEVIEMGEVIANVNADPKSGLAHLTYLTHGPDGLPSNCAGLEASWASTVGGWGDDVTGGMGAPKGGLYGIAYHISVEDAAAWGFEPAAIANWNDTLIHRDPGSDEPNLGQGVDTALVPDGGSYLTFQRDATRPGIDSVSALFMTRSITNDVMLNSAIGGATDWVTTFPTKYDYVNELVTAITPFTDIYSGFRANASDTAYIEYRACEPLVPTYLDREEATTVAGNNFSPAPPGAAGIAVCDETNVTAWGTGTDSALNVERDLFNLSFPYVEGWARWTFNDADHVLPSASGSSLSLLGLPAMGFGAYAYANGSMGGVLMNYGHAAEHKTDVFCSGTSCPSYTVTGN
jgi:hypothetical protein